MTAFQDFLDTQEEIYDRFRDTSAVQENGLTPSKPVIEGQGGYLIALRHNDSVVEPMARFAERLTDIVPVITYDASNVHTALSAPHVSPRFAPDDQILEELAVGVFQMVHALEKPSISYIEWLYNQDTVILAGNPDQRFYTNLLKMERFFRDQGQSLPLPAMAHMTAARFTEPVPPCHLHDFYELMQDAPDIGTSKPEEILVGYFTMDAKNGFKVHEYESLIL
ncbi:hypothetical protein CMO92_04535 [Candidatus Woesearchaeota archaeon]|nr:hypothetical protein [Candidatus Woesearchaeota archaeon]|tara:strand:- start:49 stop:717 length:669 start_codon:yes stop_codon:yes gene_type:complete